MHKPSTLKDIAQLAGVSTATVARVLHDKGYVSAEARARVEEAVARTGYRINVLAQGLRKRRTMTVGHLLHGLFPNPFFAGVARGVEGFASRHGYSVLLVDAHSDPTRERVGVETLLHRRVDAIIFNPVLDPANLDLALEAGVSVVQVERGLDQPGHQVWVNNQQGSFEAVEHLLGLGHRRIAYLGGRPSQDRPRNVEQQRFEGYFEALRRHGLEPDERLILLGEYHVLDLKDPDYGAGEHSVGFRHTRQLLELTQPPTAIFAASDLLASGALQALSVAGVRVPEEVSVVGFDNTLAPFLSPPLTTVALPLLEIGEAAAELAISTGGDGWHSRELSTSLLRRRSTAPALGQPVGTA